MFNVCESSRDGPQLQQYEVRQKSHACNLSYINIRHFIHSSLLHLTTFRAIDSRQRVSTSSCNATDGSTMRHGKTYTPSCWILYLFSTLAYFFFGPPKGVPSNSGAPRSCENDEISVQRPLHDWCWQISTAGQAYSPNRS